MKRKEPTVSVVHDKEHVPPGYVPLGTLATDSGSTPLYGYVQRAFERGEWARSLFKCRGKRFIHRDDLERLTAEFNARQTSDSVDVAKDDGGTAPHAESLCLSLADIGTTLVEIRCVLERLTNAVESITTQPNVRFEDATEASWNGTHGNTN